MATNTFTQVSGALTSTAANWSGGLPVGIVDALVLGANATLDSNISGASLDLNGNTIAATVSHTITGNVLDDLSNGGTIHGAVGQLITINGNFTGMGTTASYLNITGALAVDIGGGSYDNITVPVLDWGAGTNSGTNFTVSGTTLMNATGTLTMTLATGLVTTRSAFVNNVTGTLNGGLAYSPDGGTTKYYNLAAIPASVRPGPGGYLQLPIRSRGRLG